MKTSSRSVYEKSEGRGKSVLFAMLRLGGVALLTVFATAIRWGFHPWLGPVEPFLTYYLVVALVAWQDTWRLAAISAILGLFAGVWLFIPPEGSLHVWDARHVTEVLVYGAVSFNIIFLAYLFRRMRREARGSAKALGEREADYHTIFESALLGHALIDAPTQGFICSNAAFCRLTGYSSEELRRMKVEDLLPPADSSTSLPQIRKVLAGEADNYQADQQLRCKSGDLIWTRLSIAAVRDETGMPVRSILEIEDFTERKQAEAAVSRTEQILRYHFENSPLVVIEFDERIRVSRWTGAAESVFGWKAEEVVGSHPNEFNLIYSPDRETVEKVFSKLLRGELQRLFNANRNVRKDGTIVHCEWYNSALLDQHGKMVSILCLGLDVTARMEAERKLQSEKAFSEAAINSLPGLFYLFDESLRFHRWNHSLEEVTGYSDAEVRQMNALDFVASEDHPKAREAIGKAFEEARVDVELQLCTKEGDCIPCLCSGRRFEFEHRRGIIGIGMDISSRKQAEAALLQAKQEWERTFDSVPDLIAIIDQEHRIKQVNKAMAARLRLDRQLCTGQLCYNCLHKTDLPPEDCPHMLTVLDHQTHSQECHQEVLGGDFLISTSPLTDAAGNTVGIVHVAHEITDWKKAEAALRQSEERLHLALEHADMGMWDLDMVNGAMVWSRRHFELLGYAPRPGHQATLEMWRCLIHPADVEEVERSFQEARRDRTLYYNEHRIFRADNGQLRWIVAAGRFRYDENGRPTRFIGVFYDNTARKQAEQSLLQSELRLRRIVNAPTVGISVSSADGKVLEVNDCYLRLLGASRVDFLAGNIDWRKNTPPEYRAMDEQAMAEMRATGLSHPFIKQYVRPDGQRVWVLVSLAMLVDRPPEEVAAFVIDITEQKRAEEALQRQNLQLKLLHDAAGYLLSATQPEYILLNLHEDIAAHFQIDVFFEYRVSSSGHTLELSSCKGVDLESEKPIRNLPFGQGICGLVAQQRQPILVPNIQSSDEPRLRFLKRLGLRCYCCQPLLVGDRLLGTLSFGSRKRDVYSDADREFFQTLARHVAFALERSRLEQALRHHASHLEHLVDERTAKLREMVAELERFSYALTHDMRAPLRAISGFIQILEMQLDDSLQPADRDLMSRITRSAHRMDRLITDALNYSKIVRNELELVPIDLDPLVRGIVESYPGFQPPHANILLEGQCPPVWGNEAALTQVFSHLLDNAVKFVAPGVVPRVRLWAENKGEMVRVWIEDNGVGISSLAQQTIFDMYARHSSNNEGTGIGLAVVRKAVERMGGKVGVESEPDRGSRFWIELKPVIVAPQDQPPAS